MVKKVKLHEGWKQVKQSKDMDFTTPSKLRQRADRSFLLYICILIVFAISLLCVHQSDAAEECLDGTWVHSQEIDDFVCVKDDGVYIPPTD